MNRHIGSLEQVLRINLHPEQLRRIHIIDNEDFSGVERKVREHGVETGRAYSVEAIDRGIFALKQYYAIAMLDPANAHAISVALDPFWHAHILHTEQYMKFCDEVVGEYMHHQPLDHANRGHVEIVRRLYSYTLRTLPRIFSEVDEEFWSKDTSDVNLICLHKGNQEIYRAIQPMRLFEPVTEGQGSLH